MRLADEAVPLLRLLADGEEGDGRVRRCRGSPRRRRSPCAPNWTRCSGRASAFAPASIRTDVPADATGAARRSPGDGRPGSRRISSSPAASIAPGVPGRDDGVGRRPRRPRGRRRTSSSSRFSRAASAGFSSMATTSSAWTISRPSRQRLEHLATAEEDGLDVVRAAPRARPRRSPPAPDRRPSRRRRPGSRHALRSGSLERLDLAAAVRAAGRADVVRPLRLMALRALDDGGRRELVRRAPLVAAGLGGFSLGDGHRRGEV